jgi:phospholipase D1/2
MPIAATFRKRRRPAWGVLVAGCVVMVAIAAAWRYTALHDIVTPENAAGWARRIRAVPGSWAILILSYTLAAAIMFPRPLLTLTSVIAFGPWRGTLYCAAGIMVAAMAFYSVGRFGSRAWVEKLAGDHAKTLEKVLREHGIAATFALNLVPAPPFSLQGMIAGALRVPVWKYAAGSFLGMLPTLFGWAFFGRQLAASLEESEGVSLWAIAAVAAAMIAVSLVVRRWFAKYT